MVCGLPSSHEAERGMRLTFTSLGGAVAKNRATAPPQPDLPSGIGHGKERIAGATQFDAASICWRPAECSLVAARSDLSWLGGAVGPVSPQPSPKVNVSLIPRSASLLLGRPQPFTVAVRLLSQNMCFAATQSAPSTKKNPALIGPGSPFEMDSKEAYWRSLLTHETRKGAIGCGTAC